MNLAFPLSLSLSLLLLEYIMRALYGVMRNFIAQGRGISFFWANQFIPNSRASNRVRVPKRMQTIFRDDVGTRTQSVHDGRKFISTGGRRTRVRPDARVVEAAAPGVRMR